jgi:hypothetical protein
LSVMSDGDDLAYGVLNALRINEWLRLICKQPASQLLPLLGEKLTEILTYSLNLMEYGSQNKKANLTAAAYPVEDLQQKLVELEKQRKVSSGKYFKLLIDIGNPIKSLFLNEKDITDNEVEDLADLLAQTDSMNEIHLQNNGISSVSGLCTYLSNTATLTYMDLRGNCICKKDIKLVGEFLSSNPRVKHVYVTNEGKVEALGSVQLPDRFPSTNDMPSILQQCVIITVDIRKNSKDGNENNLSVKDDPPTVKFNVPEVDVDDLPLKIEAQETSPLASRIKALEKRLSTSNGNNGNSNVESEFIADVQDVSLSPLSRKIKALERELENQSASPKKQRSRRRPRSALR